MTHRWVNEHHHQHAAGKNIVGGESRHCAMPKTMKAHMPASACGVNGVMKWGVSGVDPCVQEEAGIEGRGCRGTKSHALRLGDQNA